MVQEIGRDCALCRLTADSLERKDKSLKARIAEYRLFECLTVAVDHVLRRRQRLQDEAAQRR